MCNIGIGAISPDKRLMIGPHVDIEATTPCPKCGITIQMKAQACGNYWLFGFDCPACGLIVKTSGCVGIGDPHPPKVLDISGKAMDPAEWGAT